MKERSIMEHCPECGSNNTIELNAKSRTWECMCCQCQWWIHQDEKRVATLSKGGTSTNVTWKKVGHPSRPIKQPGIHGTGQDDFFYETPEKK